MVAQVIGKYLIERGIISRGQMMILHKERKRLRARLSLVAISEGLMAPDEAKALEAEIVESGPLSDRAFADAALEKGYLSKGQIASLASKQGDSYLCFVQALEKMNIIDIVQLEEVTTQFPIIENPVQLDDLKSNDVNRIIPLFIPPEATKYINAAVCAVRYLESKVDSNIYPFQPASVASIFPGVEACVDSGANSLRGVFQVAQGDREFAYGLVAYDQELAGIASSYLHELKSNADDEVLDVLCEILNKISTAYATQLSQDSILVDLMPAKSHAKISTISASEMLILPLSIKHETFYLIYVPGMVEIH